jgi:hypothetical protein
VWIDVPGWQASSSYVEPVAVVGAEPDAAPTVCVEFSAAWLPYVLGSLQQLTQPAAWATGDPTALGVVLQQATALCSIFGQAEECPVLSFRFTDACILQYSTDGGDTWTDTPGWATFAPGCFTGPTGPTGPTGAAGVTPQLRWSGCSFQVSTDGGATWADLSGFSIDTLNGCLPGTPVPPGGVTVSQNACNIANWLAIQILQGSMSSLAGSLAASATTLEAALGLLGLAAGWSGLGAITFEAAGIFVAAGTAIGESALNTAAADTTLREDLTCAIYAAIVADGHVTAANFSAVVSNIEGISYATPGIIGLIGDYVSNMGFSGINAIQSEGTLFAGSCPTCGTWCYEFDLTLSDGGWVAVDGSNVPNTAYGSWVSGVGWQSVNQTFGADHSRLWLLKTGIPIPASGCTVELFYYVNSNSLNGFHEFDSYLSGSPVQTNNLSATMPDMDITLTIPQFDSANFFIEQDSHTSDAFLFTKIIFRGVGPNPFGADNCT